MANEPFEFQLADFRIVSSKFNLNVEKEFEQGMLHEMNVKLAMKHDFIEESKSLRLFLKVEMGGPDQPFTLSMEGGAFFNFSHQMDEPDALRKLAEINCAGITFPYLREAVADIIRRGGFPPLHLPPINFVDLYYTNHPEAAPA
jgi:preprotein translocase subunit SecB